MNLDDLLRQPWFYRSPGPISLFYYTCIIVTGAWLLTKRVEYRKWRLVNAVTDSFFLNGFVILSADILWMLFSGWKFLPSYPDSLVQVVAVLGRNVAGMMFCFMLVGNRLKEGAIRFSNATFWGYAVLIVFFTVVFGVAETPALTDWTYAIRYGYSTHDILVSLFGVYGVGKVLTIVLLWSWWRTPK